jgi:hypothetical protein
MMVFAGGVADFGTVSKSKITLNPAGAAAIDRILFDITVFQFEQNNALSPLSSQARTSSGSPAEMYFPTTYYNPYKVEAIKYTEGEITGGHVDLAYPTKFFTLGIGFDDRRENYKKGQYYIRNPEGDTDGLDLSLQRSDRDCCHTSLYRE